MGHAASGVASASLLVTAVTVGLAVYAFKSRQESELRRQQAEALIGGAAQLRALIADREAWEEVVFEDPAEAPISYVNPVAVA